MNIKGLLSKSKEGSKDFQIKSNSINYSNGRHAEAYVLILAPCFTQNLSLNFSQSKQIALWPKQS